MPLPRSSSLGTDADLGPTAPSYCERELQPGSQYLARGQQETQYKRLQRLEEVKDGQDVELTEE